MAKNRKTLLISLSCALALIIALCGFGAYAGVTYYSESSNVSTTAVDVEQHQYRWAEDNFVEVQSSQSSDDNEIIFPVKLPSPSTSGDDSSGFISTGKGINSSTASYKLWASPNAIDRIVCVESKGIAAYVRTTFAFEAGNLVSEHIKLNRNESDWNWSGFVKIKIGSVDYWAISATYKKELESGKWTTPSLYQFAFSEDVKSQHVNSFNGIYQVQVKTEAVQAKTLPNVEGGETAPNDLSSAFKALTAECHPWDNNGGTIAK